MLSLFLISKKNKTETWNNLFVKIITMTVVNMIIIREALRIVSVNVDVLQKPINSAIKILKSLNKENQKVMKKLNLSKRLKEIRVSNMTSYIKWILMILLIILWSRKVQHNKKKWKSQIRKNRKRLKKQLMKILKHLISEILILYFDTQYSLKMKFELKLYYTLNS